MASPAVCWAKGGEGGSISYGWNKSAGLLEPGLPFGKNIATQWGLGLGCSQPGSQGVGI